MAVPVKILSISDKVIDNLQSPEAASQFEDIDFILACGDLPYYYVENVIESLKIPTFFVRGNHASVMEYGVKGARSAPIGAIDLHQRVVNFNNVLLAGFEGSVRYRTGPYMYTQPEMWLKVLGIIPKLLSNKLIYGRYLDILVTHASPWGVHDQPDVAHQGFKAFSWLLKTFKPSYHFHGHIHVYSDDQPTDTLFYKTMVINTYGFRKTVVYPGKRHYSGQAYSKPLRPKLGSPADDFRDARRKGAIQSILASLTGKSAYLLPFEEVRKQLGTDSIRRRGLQTIPMDAIAGSVGRYDDFTRKFFPRHQGSAGRWTRVKTSMGSTAVMPPIDVYQIGEVYFVLDGNHRVSIARQKGDTHIRAYVTEIESKVSISPDDQPDDLIIKAQQVKFLEDTKLDDLRPNINFSVTAPGRYRQLRELISIHQYLMEMDQHYPIPFEEALLDWVDEVFTPAIRIIWQFGLLREFPKRTPTDLFLWLVSYQNELAQEIGWQVDPERAAGELVAKKSPRLMRVIRRLKDQVLQFLHLKKFDPGPAPGEWRRVRSVPRRDDCLFCASLAAIDGSQAGWNALEQARIVAEREGGTVRGIHILPVGKFLSMDKFRQLREKFDQCLEGNANSGEFVVDQGEVDAILVNRARWNDLLVFGLSHPPGDKPIARVRSGVRTMIQTSSRPLLVVPAVSSMTKALLAYDGSPKADEALFLGSYMAERWGVELVVATATNVEKERPESLAKAKLYLQSRKIKAQFFHQIGDPGEVLIKIAKDNDCDFIIMGGYGYRPLLEVVLGSTVDYVLRQYNYPVLICR